MSKTKMQELSDLGQSVWLDYISRALLEGDKLKGLINDGLRGMTSNPSIFHQAISKSKDYDEKMSQLSSEGKSTFEVYDELTVTDIREACDMFNPVYESTQGLDGYVSLEINPQLANDTDASIKEGKRLFAKVQRPNLMIKVPATHAGFPVIEELLADGINVNVTLIFSLDQYVNTVKAFFKGLQRRLQQGHDVNHVRSVASVFVSRIDTTIDKLLDEKISYESDEDVKQKLSSLQGAAAVANSTIVFAKFKELFNSDEFKALSDKGAHVQRVLWGSTSTKNPGYKDTKYVDELIGEPTVNTIPEKTLEAFLDHGTAKITLSEDDSDSQKIVSDLRGTGIDINEVCAQLLADGVTAFEKAFVELLASIETKAQSLAVKA